MLKVATFGPFNNITHRSKLTKDPFLQFWKTKTNFLKFHVFEFRIWDCKIEISSLFFVPFILLFVVVRPHFLVGKKASEILNLKSIKIVNNMSINGQSIRSYKNGGKSLKKILVLSHVMRWLCCGIIKLFSGLISWQVVMHEYVKDFCYNSFNKFSSSREVFPWLRHFDQFSPSRTWNEKLRDCKFAY